MFEINTAPGLESSSLMAYTQTFRSPTKEYSLLYRYGITLKEYNKLVKIQGNKCGICGASPKNRALHLDHKHQPKEKQLRKKKEQYKIRLTVRGALCWRCNVAIQKFKDDPVLLRMAAVYLENPPARKVIGKQS